MLGFGEHWQSLSIDIKVIMKRENWARLVKETYLVADPADGKTYPRTIIVTLYHGRKLWEKPKQYSDLYADYASEAKSPWLGTIFIDVCNTDIDELLLDAVAPSRLLVFSLRNESIEEIAAVMTQLGRQDTRVNRAYYF